MHARHLAHFPGPQPCGIDHVFRPDVALVGNHLPAAVPLRFQGFYPGVAIDGGALPSCSRCITMGNPVGIDMTLVSHVDAAFQISYINDRAKPANFSRADEFRFDPHEPVPGCFVLQKIPPGIGSGQIDTAGQVYAYRLTGDFFDFVIQVDGVLLQTRNIRVPVECMESASGMPGGPCGQFLALQQDHVRPAQPGKVVQDTATDHAAADHNNPGMCFHALSSSYTCIRKKRIL